MGLLLLSSDSISPPPGSQFDGPSSLVWDGSGYLYVYGRTPLGHLGILQIPTADLSAFKMHAFSDDAYDLDGSQAPLVKGAELIFQLNHGESRAIQKLCVFTELDEES